MMFSDWVENIVGKEEIACHEQFFLFPQCFQSCLLLMRWNEYLWSKGLTNGTKESFIMVKIHRVKLLSFFRKRYAEDIIKIRYLPPILPKNPELDIIRKFLLTHVIYYNKTSNTTIKFVTSIFYKEAKFC